MRVALVLGAVGWGGCVLERAVRAVHCPVNTCGGRDGVNGKRLRKVMEVACAHTHLNRPDAARFSRSANAVWFNIVMESFGNGLREEQ
jgi:hypothetical protein